MLRGNFVLQIVYIWKYFGYWSQHCNKQGRGREEWGRGRGEGEEWRQEGEGGGTMKMDGTRKGKRKGKEREVLV